MNDGYIKLWSSFTKWDWYDDVNTARLFIHLLLKVVQKDTRYKGMEIPRGSYASSISRLAKATNLSDRNIRTALKHLEKTGEITITKSPHITLYTVNNYDKYQSEH
jgi:hypothetical protein